MSDNGQALELRKTRVQHAGRLITSYEQKFAAVVPSHISVKAFVELAIAYVKKDDDLLAAAHANPQSLILVLRECAALGHMPMKGVFALTWFNDKNAPGGKSIVGMEEWRGVVERIFRAGAVESVHVNVGRDNDPVCDFNPVEMVLPKHKYDAFGSPLVRGPLKVVYAWARLPRGAVSQVAWLPRYEVLRHRAMSKSAQKAGGGNFWGPEDGEGPNTEAMWKKTALHVLEGFVPTSAEYRMQLAAAEAGSRGWADVPDRPVSPPYSGGDFIDVEFTDQVPAGAPAAVDAPVGSTASATKWPQVNQPGSGQLPKGSDDAK